MEGILVLLVFEESPPFNLSVTAVGCMMKYWPPRTCSYQSLVFKPSGLDLALLRPLLLLIILVYTDYNLVSLLLVASRTHFSILTLVYEFFMRSEDASSASMDHFFAFFICAKGQRNSLLL